MYEERGNQKPRRTIQQAHRPANYKQPCLNLEIAGYHGKASGNKPGGRRLAATSQVNFQTKQQVSKMSSLKLFRKLQAS